LRRSQQEQARIATLKDHILPISPRRHGLLNDADVMTSLERYPLERITSPVLAISAQDDDTRLRGSRYTAEQIPGARLSGSSMEATCWSGMRSRLRMKFCDL